jgi:hypothetical protein
MAYAGVALAAAAAVILLLLMFFGDLFLKSERGYRRWMGAFTWCVVGGLFATAAVAAWTVVRLHH